MEQMYQQEPQRSDPSLKLNYVMHTDAAHTTRSLPDAAISRHMLVSQTVVGHAIMGMQPSAVTAVSKQSTR